MITLDQFRGTGVDVEDVTDYNGYDYPIPIPGRVYMDGTLHIENLIAGSWGLCIGSQEYAGPLVDLEEILYNWAKDEYGIMFDTEYRIPPCPINPTEQQMWEWFREMHVRGLSFHPDDRPEEVVSGTQNKFLFHDNECEALGFIMPHLFHVYGERVYEVANEVVGVTTGGEE